MTEPKSEKSPELLPCPFFIDAIPKYGKCQFGNYVQSLMPENPNENKYGDMEYYRLGYFDTKEQAIAAWNTRQPHAVSVTAVPLKFPKVTLLSDSLMLGDYHRRRKEMGETLLRYEEIIVYMADMIEASPPVHEVGE